MKVLVAAASRYGSTAEIAQAIGDVLQSRGFEVTVALPGDVGALSEFDAVVLGSAVYTGQHTVRGLQRAALLFFRSVEGDFRDWKTVREWAGSIADQLSEATAA